jgi:ABC-type transport system involved in multi-copper enzyme maturation permease subunit
MGVMFSTFLNGPVAMIATVSSIVLGFFTQFIIEVALGEAVGGGPLESMVRIISQKNMTSELEQNFGTILVKLVDEVAMFFMHAAAHLLPNFRTYSTADSVANGFNIDGNLVAQNLTTCLAYLLCTFVAGYFFFRIREVAK